MRNKTILVTGGAGYIGSVIVGRVLQEGYRVKVVDMLCFNKNIPLLFLGNPNYEFIKMDISKGSLGKYLDGVDYIIHTAAVVGEPACNKFPELAKKVNYDSSIKLFESAKKHGLKGFIFFSTCSNYGVQKGFATEESELKPLSLYSETKVNMEKYIMKNSKNLNWVICRLSTVYGPSPRMRFDLTVNDFTLNAYQKKNLEVFLPTTHRPYIHTYDLASSILSIISNFSSVKNNVFNIGFNSENYQKILIAKIVKKNLPGLKIKVVNRGVDLRDYKVDFSKMKKYLKIKNMYTIDDGVKQVINMLESGIVNHPEDKIYNNLNL